MSRGGWTDKGVGIEEISWILFQRAPLSSPLSLSLSFHLLTIDFWGDLLSFSPVSLDMGVSPLSCFKSIAVPLQLFFECGCTVWEYAVFHHRTA